MAQVSGQEASRWKDPRSHLWSTPGPAQADPEHRLGGCPAPPLFHCWLVSYTSLVKTTRMGIVSDWATSRLRYHPT
eukprot:5750637-Pyramimonas_sp.AAC.1